MLRLGLAIFVLVMLNLLWWYVEKKLGPLIWHRASSLNLLGPIFDGLGWR
jgi:hypothetical protein